MIPFKHKLGYAALRFMVGFFGLMPVPLASATGGAIGRLVGPHTRFNHIAQRNLELCLPERAHEHTAILNGMWDNLGRTMAEYPHLKTLAQRHTTINDPHNVFNTLHQHGGLFLGGHTGNWELLIAAAFFQKKLAVHAVYRPPNNKLVDVWLKRSRSFGGNIKLFGKTRKGALEMMRALQNKETVGVLMDQKDNTGVSLRFFGRPANTNISFAEMLMRTNTQAGYTFCRRVKGVDFAIDLTPAPVEGAAETIAQNALTVLENFIRQNPSQFLWIHRRFEKDLYR